MINFSSPHLWGTLFLLFLGWGTAGFFRVSYDRITLLVRVSLLFSAVFVSATIFWLLSDGAALSILLKYIWIFSGFFLGGVLIRFVPLIYRSVILFFLVILVTGAGSAVSASLPGACSRTFGTGVYLNENTIELRIRYWNPELREESFFIQTENGPEEGRMSIHVLKPSPFLFRKSSLYFYLDFSTGDSGTAVSRFPAMSSSERAIQNIVAFLGLAEYEHYVLQIPQRILRLYFLEFDESGVPSISAEY